MRALQTSNSAKKTTDGGEKTTQAVMQILEYSLSLLTCISLKRS